MKIAHEQHILVPGMSSCRIPKGLTEDTHMFVWTPIEDNVFDSLLFEEIINLRARRR